MNELSIELVSKAARLAKELSDVLTQLAESNGGSIAPVVYPDISKQLAAQICLQCGEPELKRYRRGLCTSCYQRTLPLFKGKPEREQRLITAGLLAPAGRPGKRTERTALDEFLENEAGSTVESVQGPSSEEIAANYFAHRDETEDELLEETLRRSRQASRKLKAPKEVVPKKTAKKKATTKRRSKRS